MNNIEFVTIVVKIIFAILSVTITYFVIPLVNELALKYKNTRLESFIKDSVLAAEQVIKGSGKGTDKKKRVLEITSEWLKKYRIEISEDELNNMIESVVFAMNHEVSVK